MAEWDRERRASYGVARADGAVLLVRAADTSNFPGTWWLPGGGIDDGETPEECVVREFLEETGLVVEPRDPLPTVVDLMRLPGTGELLRSTRYIFEVEVVGGVLREEDGVTAEMPLWCPLDSVPELQLMPFVADVLFG